MPRYRTIKPSFWSDRALRALNPIDRLVFLGLMSMADDAGRLVDSPMEIDAFIFGPGENFLFGPVRESTRRSLEALSSAGQILRYSVADTRLIQIAAWNRHQSIDHPGKRVLPAPTEPSSATSAIEAALAHLDPP